MHISERKADMGSDANVFLPRIYEKKNERI